MDVLKENRCFIKYFTIIVLIYVLSFLLMVPDGFWTTDNGNKYIQMRSLIDNHYSSASIHWVGKKFDSKFTLMPLPSLFSIIKDSKIYSVFPITFAFLSSLFYILFGIKGIYVIPLVSSLLSLIGLWKICVIINLEKKTAGIAMVISAFATPLWFYSLTFWEHTITVALCVWAIYFMLLFFDKNKKKYLFFVILLLTFSVYFREELILFELVVIFIVLFRQKEKILEYLLFIAVIFFLSILPFFIINKYFYGNILGFHLYGNIKTSITILQHFKDRISVFYNLYVTSNTNMIVSYFMFVAHIFFVFVLSKIKTDYFYRIYYIYLLYIFVFTIVINVSFFEKKLSMIYINGFFSASAFLFLLFVRKRNLNLETETKQKDVYKMIFNIIFLFAFLYFLLTPKTGSSGLHWGNRFLLLLYSFMVILFAIKKNNLFKAHNNLIEKNLIFAVIIVSIILQIFSIQFLYNTKLFFKDFNKYINEQRESVIITSRWNVSQDLAFNFFNKSIYFINSKKQVNDLKRLFIKLKKKGIKSVLFITEPNSLKRYRAIKYFRFKNQAYYNVKIIKLKI